MDNKILIIFLVTLTLSSIIIPNALAQEYGDDEITTLGFDLEELLSLINSIIALTLFFFAFVAYKVDGRKRFLYVSIAFLLFALKSFLDSLEIFGIDIEILGSLAVILEFFVLIVFFFGVVKRER